MQASVLKSPTIADDDGNVTILLLLAILKCNVIHYDNVTVAVFSQTKRFLLRETVVFSTAFVTHAINAIGFRRRI